MGTSFSRKRSSSQSPPLKKLLSTQHAQKLLSKSQPNSFTSLLRAIQEEGQSKPHKQKQSWMPFTQGSLLSKDEHNDKNSAQFHMLGIHYIGPRTYIETVLEGTKFQLEELRLTLLHTFANSQQVEKRKIWKDGQITIFAGTDFNLRHRLSVESIVGSEEKGLTFATIVSTNFTSAISWGVANSYRPYKDLTLFSRFTSDDYSKKGIILQAVQKLNDKNTLSPVYAATSGGQSQAGISWTHQFNSGTEDNVQVKALCNNEGSFSVNVKAQVGEVR